MPLFAMPGRSRGKHPHARLTLYVILLAAAGAAFFRLHEIQKAELSTPPPSKQVYRLADPVEGSKDPLNAVQPLPRFLGKIVDADLRFDDHAAAQRAHDLETNSESIHLSFSYLKGLGSEGLKAETEKYQHFTWSRLMQYPDKWRGRAVHLYGVVLQIDEVTFPELPKGLRKMFLLTLNDARLAHFYTVLTPALSTDIKVNARVAVDGLFLKRYPYWCKPIEAVPGFWQWTPLLLSAKVYAAWEPTPPADLLSDPEETFVKLKTTRDTLDIPFLEDQLLDVAKSGKGFRSMGPIEIQHEREARRIPEEKLGFEHLFEYVHHWSPQQLAAMVDNRVFFENLMTGDRAPAWAKWQTGEMEGWVRFVERIHVTGLKSGIERIYVVTVTDGTLGNFDYNWSIATLNLPENLREGDYVKAHGVFAKLYPYQSRKNEWHWTPLLVSADLVKGERDSLKAPLWLYILGTVVLLGIVITIAFSIRREDQRRMRNREKIKERRAARDAIRAIKKLKPTEEDLP